MYAYYLRVFMALLPHTAIYTTGNTDTKWLIHEMQQGTFFHFSNCLKLHGEIFSDERLNYFIEEEHRHGRYLLSTINQNELAQASNGEQRMALLQYIIAKKPAYIILDNVYSSLDTDARQYLLNILQSICHHTLLLQIITRKKDCLPFIQEVYSVHEKAIVARQNPDSFLAAADVAVAVGHSFANAIPAPLIKYPAPENPLVKMENVSVDFDGRKILHNICWQINTGECWQLTGPNGSGKSTLLAVITGDSPKGYGQDLILFGNKKGSGESVWDIKEKIGYFSSGMLQHYNGRHSALQMIAGGLFDSVGLYFHPTESQVNLAEEWLQLLGMTALKNCLFVQLSMVQQRLLLLARAMIKHPPLLILDEPVNGLNDEGALLFTALVNRIAAQETTAIIYVSHQKEEGLYPQYIFHLQPGANGSEGIQLL